MSFTRYLLILLILASCNQAQKNQTYIDDSFSIDGTLINLPKNSLIILERDHGNDTIKVVNGRFFFKGKLEGKAEQVLLRTHDYKFYKFFWLENAKVKVKGDIYKPQVINIEGSHTELLSNQLDRLAKPRQHRIDSLKNLMIDSTKASTSKTSDRQLSLEQNELDKIYLSFIRHNPKSPVSISLLNTYQYEWGKVKTQELFKLLNADNQNSKVGQNISEFIKLNQPIEVGNKYANVTQYNPKGERKELSDFIGKPLLVEFWASWCVPCRKSNTELLKIYHNHKSKGFEIVAISIDEDKENWLKAIKEDKLDWQHLSEQHGGPNKAEKVYGINAIPSNVLIDSDGIIIAKNVDNQKLQRTLSILLADK